jgi:hypothetical protein
MGAPDLPTELKTFLASPSMREHHALWHFIRAFWDFLPKARQGELTAANWNPPNNRMQTMPGSGIDFLGMHRDMLQEVREFVADRHLVADVTGWPLIPWSDSDPDWPMPPTYPEISNPEWKEPLATNTFREEFTSQYGSVAWMQSHSLDELGIAIENGIHQWMHIHWSAAPWFKNAAGQDINDIQNDFLACPYSSHVNKHFWKIHGWIDDRITAWANLHDGNADLSNAWNGPPDMDHMSMPSVIKPDEIKIACSIFSGKAGEVIARLGSASPSERTAIFASLA